MKPRRTPLSIDPTGAFGFDGLRPGPYTITASAPGYTDSAVAAEVAGDAEARVGALLLRHDSETAEGVPLTVTVALADGAPPVGTTVRVTFAGDEASFVSGLADAGGALAVMASPEETYFVEVEHPDYAPAGRRGPFHYAGPARGFVDAADAPPE